MDLPPQGPERPALVAPAPECMYVSKSAAQVAMANLQRSLPGTPFVSARPSEICGLVRLEMASGKVVYTDATGRFLLLTFALDTHKGEPADNAAKLDKTLEDRQTFPSEPIPNVFPLPPGH